MNDTSIFSVINKLYNKVGFLEKYGGSLWMTVIVILVFFIAISYYYIYNNLQPIKADWANQKCNPTVMPFAGLINPPDPKKMSAFDFTAQNFTGCIQNILSDIAGTFLAPFYYLVNSLTKTLDGLNASVQAIRGVLNTIRNSVGKVSEEIMGKALNIMIPLQQIIIKIKDTINKTQGIMLSSIYMLMGIYQTITASFGAIIQIIMTFLMSIASIMTILFFIPFGLGIPFAIPLLVIFIMILVPGIMVYIIQVMVLKKWVNPLPGIPSCFIGDTDLTLHGGSKIKIKDIDVGMVLQNNNVVTAKMKLANIDETIYCLNGIYCTGEHVLKYNNSWIKTKDHPHSTKTDMYCDYLYCINTSKKVIHINNDVFGDWDELDNAQIDELKQKCNKYLPKQFELHDIHKYLDGGFIETTKIELQDGHNINICDIEVNDVLRFGERVTGIVKIKADDLETKQFNLGKQNSINGGPNLHICDSDLGMKSTLDIYGEKVKCDYVYHIITNKRTFHVNGIKFYDYNSCIDKYLELENHKLLNVMI
tara:strand:+ start:709 stop:2310 length:1602 start_codon:yes stop_codon:yes gene_type:complete